jgi:hypothetical protein
MCFVWISEQTAGLGLGVSVRLIVFVKWLIGQNAVQLAVSVWRLCGLCVASVWPVLCSADVTKGT